MPTDASRCRRRRRSCGVQMAGELGEDGQIGVELHAAESANSQRQQGPLMLERSEPGLNVRALLMELLVALRVARDERVQPVTQVFNPVEALSRGAADQTVDLKALVE